MPALLTVLPLLLATNVEPSADWETLASAYVAADVAVLLAQDETALRARVARRDEAAHRLVQQPGPTDEEMVSNLQSADSARRVSASAVVIARARASERVVRALANAFGPESPFYGRYYVLEAILRAQPEVAARFAQELVPRLAEERSEPIQRQALVYLARGDLAVALPVFVRYMEAGSPAIQLATYGIVRSLGREATSRFAAALERGRSRDALRAIEVFRAGDPESMKGRNPNSEFRDSSGGPRDGR